VSGLPSQDAGAFIDEIKLRVDSINNLPRDAYRPQVSRWQNSDQIAGFALHGEIPAATCSASPRNPQRDFLHRPGASLVEIMGVLGEEVAIEVSEEAMRRYGVSFAEIAQAIASSSMNTSAGSVRTDLGDVRIAARELADTAYDFENIIVRQTPAAAWCAWRCGDRH
jgi:multidrug efflux pump subunit AcrB